MTTNSPSSPTSFKRSLSLLLFTILSILPSLVAAAATCGSGLQCGSATPCCSEYGYCGTGSYCLAGCDPFSSWSPSACAPTPICQDQYYNFSSLISTSTSTNTSTASGNNNSSDSGSSSSTQLLGSGFLVNGSVYNGNAQAAQFTLDQGHVEQTAAGDLVLTLTQAGGGTKISTTRLVWYGTITARIKTSNWPGVVTAFITMSGIRDEIDWEFPGNNSRQGQTNYFWEGLVDYTHGGNATLSTDRDDNWHDYTIDWQPDELNWKVDNVTVRTLSRVSTYNTSTGLYQYPQTPSKVQLSIWPGGLAGTSAGTVTWAGGEIDWSNPDYVANGYYYAQVRSLSIQCATPNITSPPSSPSSSSSSSSNSSDTNSTTTTTPSFTSYEYYNNSTLGSPFIKLSTDPTMIYSQLGTGLDMTRGKPWFAGSGEESAVMGGQLAQGLGVGSGVLGIVFVVATTLMLL